MFLNIDQGDAMPRIGCIYFAGALFSAMSLCAQSHYGIQIGLSAMPLGDLKDSVNGRPGFSFGFHEFIDYDNGIVLRPRADVNVYPQFKLSGIQNKAPNMTAGSDYLYFASGGTTGFYAGSGAYLVRWSSETFTSSKVGSVSGDVTKLEVAAIMGCQWNSILGTETRFIYSRVDANYKARALEFGLTIRL